MLSEDLRNCLPRNEGDRAVSNVLLTGRGAASLPAARLQAANLHKLFAAHDCNTCSRCCMIRQACLLHAGYTASFTASILQAKQLLPPSQLLDRQSAGQTVTCVWPESITLRRALDTQTHVTGIGHAENQPTLHTDEEAARQQLLASVCQAAAIAAKARAAIAAMLGEANGDADEQ